MSDEPISDAQRIAALEAEVARLQAAASGGTGVIVGPGTPEHFAAVGGVGDVVLHPETGEPLLNSQTGAPIMQEHPRRAAEAELAGAQHAVEKAQADLAAANARLAAAVEGVAAADALYDEIVADLVANSTVEAG